MKCLTEQQLLASLDGGVAPNEQGSVESHLAGCGSCRAARTELEVLVGDLAVLPELDEEAHVKTIMARLDDRRPIAPATKRPGWLLAGSALTAVAIAAGALLFVRSSAEPQGDAAFAARGGAAERTLARDVGIRVLTGDKTLTPLAPGATVSGDASFTASYTNVHDKPAYLLLFAVDGRGEVHWLYPAYTSTQENPAGTALRRNATETAMDTSVVLDRPAPGALRFVTVVTEQPLHVLDIEGRPASTLAKEAIERTHPGALVTELEVRVDAKGDR